MLTKKNDKIDNFITVKQTGNISPGYIQTEQTFCEKDLLVNQTKNISFLKLRAQYSTRVCVDIFSIQHPKCQSNCSRRL